MDHNETDQQAEEEAVPRASDVDLMDTGDEVVPAPPASRSARRRRPPSLLSLIRAALVLVVLAALAFTTFEWTQSRSQDSLRKSALAAASTYGGYLSSYDYKNLTGPTAPWTEVDRHSTASFRKDFDATRANLKSLVTDYKATATGKVIAAGISSLTSSRAVALLFIDQTVTNTAQKPGTTTQPLRVELVMARQNGHWLIDKLEVPK